MYSVSGYGKMIADAARMEAYVSALRQSIKPGSVVIDLGAGPGVFALLACQLGARRVYAIEPDNVIEVARQAAVANGYSERVVFIQDFSTRVTLPELADVIISDLRGVLPWFQKHLPSIADARRRLLKPSGIVIPRRDVLWAAPVDTPQAYSDIVDPWRGNRYGLDLSSAQHLVTNAWRKLRVTPEQLIAKPAQWCILDYANLETADISGEMSWTIEQPRTAHGLSVWFDSELVDGVGFSNGPDKPELIYGNAFFPFSSPVELAPGDEIKIQLSADLVDDDYVWRWNTEVAHNGYSEAKKTRFKQSSFFGVPVAAAQLRKHSSSYMPRLSDEGIIERFILSLMDGTTTLDQIARQLTQLYPNQFANYGAALDIVSAVALRYSE